jgi:hypothetical protein
MNFLLSSVVSFGTIEHFCKKRKKVMSLAYVKFERTYSENTFHSELKYRFQIFTLWLLVGKLYTTLEFNTSTWVGLSTSIISPVPKHRNMRVIVVLNQYYPRGYVHQN